MINFLKSLELRSQKNVFSQPNFAKLGGVFIAKEAVVFT